MEICAPKGPIHLLSDKGSGLALRWMYIDFNSYFASVEQQLDPRLRGYPVIVIPSATEATCAIAASYEAKALGIKTGTMVRDALDICPHLITVMARHDHYVRYHHLLLAEIENRVPISEVCSIDEAACRLMDNENTPEQVHALAVRIKQGIASRVGAYLRCSIGVAANKYLAKVAAGMRKPDQVTILDNDKAWERLRQLELRDLPGIGMAMERRLIRAGIFCMDDLLRLDRRQMRTVWRSIHGERMWYLLRGVELADDPVRRRSIGHSHVIAPVNRHPARARLIAKRLVQKAASRLRRLGYDASAFALSMRTGDGKSLKRWTYTESCQNTLHFLMHFQRMWTGLLSALPPDQRKQVQVRKVSIQLFNLTPCANRHAHLFDDVHEWSRQGRGEQLSHALDRINHRFGRDSIVIGMMPQDGRDFSESKIAFTRIPDIKEFLE